MKKKVLTALLIIETVLLTVILIFGLFRFNTGKTEKEVYRQMSEDGSQNVVIYEVGEPDWPFGKAHYKGLQTSLSMFLMTEEEDNLLSSGKKLL